MRQKTKNVLKQFLPPVFLKLVAQRCSNYGFKGNYKTWAEAKEDTVGYDNSIILEKVKNSLLKVKNGEAAYERDSFLFDKIEYSWPILTSLLWVASKNNGRLNIIDFGGSLGSTYFQNISFLSHLKELRWNIIEQEDFVNCGKKYFENNSLKFFNSINSCFKETNPNAIFILSTIQYLEDPYNFLKEILSYDFQFIVFDRTTFLKSADRITIQKVPPEIYPASYPAWFLNESKFLRLLNEKYNLVAEFDALGGIRNLGDINSFEKGFIFIKKNEI